MEGAGVDSLFEKTGICTEVAFHWLSYNISSQLACCQARRNSSFLVLGSKVVTFWNASFSSYTDFVNWPKVH